MRIPLILSALLVLPAIAAASNEMTIGSDEIATVTCNYPRTVDSLASPVAVVVLSGPDSTTTDIVPAAGTIVSTQMNGKACAATDSCAQVIIKGSGAPSAAEQTIYRVRILATLHNSDKQACDIKLKVVKP